MIVLTAVGLILAVAGIGLVVAVNRRSAGRRRVSSRVLFAGGIVAIVIGGVATLMSLSTASIPA